MILVCGGNGLFCYDFYEVGVIVWVVVDVSYYYVGIDGNGGESIRSLGGFECGFYVLMVEDVVGVGIGDGNVDICVFFGYEDIGYGVMWSWIWEFLIGCFVWGFEGEGDDDFVFF